MILALLTVLVPTINVVFSQYCPPISRPISFKFGHLKGTIVSDGPVNSVQNFFANIPQQAVVRSARANFYSLPPSFGQNVLILDTPSARIMFDTGTFNVDFPGFEYAGQLFTNLKAAGISTSSIDAIFISHGHLDHVAGLIDRKGRRAFPNAKIYVGRREHKYWKAEPFINASPRLDNASAGKIFHILYSSDQQTFIIFTFLTPIFIWDSRVTACDLQTKRETVRKTR